MEKITINREEIESWAKKRGGIPKVIDHPESEGDPVGLRIDFPGTMDDAFLDNHLTRKISWDNFFDRFDEMGLAFVFEKDNHLNDISLSYRFINRDEINSFEA